MDSLRYIAVIAFSGFMVEASVSRFQLNTTDTVDSGDWGNPEHCKEGLFANAFQIKVENTTADTTAIGDEMSAVRLFCKNGRQINSSQGANGNYKGKRECESGYLNSFRLRAIIKSNTDFHHKHGAFDLQMMCDGSNKTLSGGGNGYGNYQAWSTCLKGWAISGIRTRIDESKGLTDLRFWCTKIPEMINAESVHDDSEGEDKNLLLIVSCTVAALLIVVIAAIILGCYMCGRKKKENQESDVQLDNVPHSMPVDTMTRRDSENSLYEAYTNETKANEDRGSKHNSENSLYESYSKDVASSLNRITRHESENSLYASAGQ